MFDKFVYASNSTRRPHKSSKRVYIYLYIYVYIHVRRLGIVIAVAGVGCEHRDRGINQITGVMRWGGKKEYTELDHHS